MTARQDTHDIYFDDTNRVIRVEPVDEFNRAPCRPITIEVGTVVGPEFEPPTIATDLMVTLPFEQAKMLRDRLTHLLSRQSRKKQA